MNKAFLFVFAVIFGLGLYGALFLGCDTPPERPKVQSTGSVARYNSVTFHIQGWAFGGRSYPADSLLIMPDTQFGWEVLGWYGDKPYTWKVSFSTLDSIKVDNTIGYVNIYGAE